MSIEGVDDSSTATEDDVGFDSGGTIYPHPALVLVPDDDPDEDADPGADAADDAEARSR